MVWLIVGVLGVYFVGCYYMMYKSLCKFPGPAGLGFLALPLAPLMGPVFIIEIIRAFARRIFS